MGKKKHFLYIVLVIIIFTNNPGISQIYPQNLKQVFSGGVKQ